MNFDSDLQDGDEWDDDFDPLELRAKRQAALANAIVQPILSSSSDKSKLSRTSEVIYPFVFDSFAKAKMAPGWLSLIFDQLSHLDSALGWVLQYSNGRPYFHPSRDFCTTFEKKLVRPK
jgi:hypothetical protein